MHMYTDVCLRVRALSDILSISEVTYLYITPVRFINLF